MVLELKLWHQWWVSHHASNVWWVLLWSNFAIPEIAKLWTCYQIIIFCWNHVVPVRNQSVAHEISNSLNFSYPTLNYNELTSLVENNNRSFFWHTNASSIDICICKNESTLATFWITIGIFAIGPMKIRQAVASWVSIFLGTNSTIFAKVFASN